MMKLVYFLFLHLLLAHPLVAQNKYATTTDGKRVILKPDGTWNYAQYDVSATRDQPSTTKSATEIKKSSTTAQSSRQYIRGPRGGCYYINRNGNKTYVDRSMCN